MAVVSNAVSNIYLPMQALMYEAGTCMVASGAIATTSGES